MVTYRKARTDEREAYIRFADMVFNTAGDGVHFENDIPKVYGCEADSASMHNLAVDDAGEIRGLVAMLPGQMEVGGETLKTGYVGTVSVHPQARGEGHMKRLMAMTLEDAVRGGMDLMVLGGQRQRYEHFGFAHGGVAYQAKITRGCVTYALGDVDAQDVTFEEAVQGSRWIGEAARLHRSRRVHCVREESHFLGICRTYQSHLWIALRSGEFLGYVVCNAEKDRIVELGVASAAGMDVLIKAWWQCHKPDALLLAVPPWEVGMLRRLAGYAETIQMQPAVHVRILDYARVIRSMLKMKASYMPVEDGRLTLEVEGKRLTVAVCNGQVTVEEGGDDPLCLSGLQAAYLLTYPFDYEGRPRTPAGWFPLPLYFPVPDQF